jgi:hypothetical protein
MNGIDIKQYAKETTDADGNRVIQIPLDVWQRFIETMPSQIEQLNALFDDWEQHPEDDMPAEWWDEFTSFLQVNRLTFDENDNN